MNLRFPYQVCVLVLSLFFCPTLAYSNPLSDKQRQEDPRLEKTVTVTTPRVFYLGELLEEVSRQTGVIIRAGDKDKASGEKIVLRAQNIPLADLMNALYSLVSYREAGWDWVVEPATPPTATASKRLTYLLTRPRPAQSLGAKIRRQIQDSFETEADAVIGGLDKVGEELDTEPEGNRNTPEYQVKKRGYAIGQALAEMLPSAEARLRTLRGQDTVRIPVSALGTKAQAYVDSEYALKREWNPGINFEKPSQVKIVREDAGNKMTSSLVIYAGNGNMMEGFSCVGGTAFENGWRQTVANQWLLPGDKLEDPALDRKIGVLLGAPQSPKQQTPASPEIAPLAGAALTLWKHTEAGPVSFIACLPGNSSVIQKTTKDTTLRTALLKLSPLQTKWRNGILLVHDPTHLVRETEEGRVSWSIVKALRQAEASSKDGLLPLDIIAKMAGELSSEQLQTLSGEFNVLSDIAHWQNWFVQMRKPGLLERLQSPQGVPIQLMRVLDTVILPPQVSAERVTAVRMQVKDTPRQGKLPSTRSITFELLGSGSKLLGRTGFFYYERGNFEFGEPIMPGSSLGTAPKGNG